MLIREGFIGVKCKAEPRFSCTPGYNVCMFYMEFEMPLFTHTIEIVRVGKVAIINRA